MRIFRHFVLLAALFIIVLHSPGHSAQLSGKFQDFTLNLATPKASYFELQPIPIFITLKNETGGSLVGNSALEFENPFLHLDIDRGDGSHGISVPLVRLHLVASSREFKPGEEVKKTECLNFKLDELFPKPGTYKLHVRLILSSGKESVSSNPIEVQIVEPDGLDAHALQFIRDHAEPAYFFTGMHAVKEPEQLQVLENFVAVYSESSYADDVSFALAEVKFAKRDYQKARELFEKLSKKSNYVYAKRVSDYLNLIEHRLKVDNRP